MVARYALIIVISPCYLLQVFKYKACLNLVSSTSIKSEYIRSCKKKKKKGFLWMNTFFLNFQCLLIREKVFFYESCSFWAKKEMHSIMECCIVNFTVLPLIHVAVLVLYETIFHTIMWMPGLIWSWIKPTQALTKYLQANIFISIHRYFKASFGDIWVKQKLVLANNIWIFFTSLCSLSQL